MALKIIAGKDNKKYIGNIETISELIGVHRNTISNWIKDKKEIIYKNGYEINLNIIEL